MAAVSLPNSIDAATPAVATEVQGNFVALRDAINGDLEGGVGNNLKANGVTAREIEDAILAADARAGLLQAGVVGAGDLKVTPGAGLALAYASGVGIVADTSGVISAISGTLIPVNVSGSTVSIAANASGNPRIDQIILTLTGYGQGTVSVLQGTASVGATLANRTGAAALPSSAIRLADILMPSGFAGPFVQNTHIRDRRPWARGAYVSMASDGSSATTTASATPVALAATTARLEITPGNFLHVDFQGFVSNSVAASIFFTLFQDGVEFANTRGQSSSHAGTNPHWFTYSFDVDPGDGSHEFSIAWWASGGGTVTLVNASNVIFRATYREEVRQNVANTGA